MALRDFSKDLKKEKNIYLFGQLSRYDIFDWEYSTTVIYRFYDYKTKCHSLYFLINSSHKNKVERRRRDGDDEGNVDGGDDDGVGWYHNRWRVTCRLFGTVSAFVRW